MKSNPGKGFVGLHYPSTASYVTSMVLGVLSAISLCATRTLLDVLSAISQRPRLIADG
ncbi:MAG: hypothetical protein F6K37_10875 [Moorea sp. SIO4E2]|uniref:hypothetical protein n=1 Tax=Moorena sp. SIO4E2 TaxID=2607826 RepID=UPI0013B86306|nr:hypothetical protein [Moorena sp. SIO4E2]NEQ06433.1 hypothetical protein [Moorena sp. SIO4E2]